MTQVAVITTEVNRIFASHSHNHPVTMTRLQLWKSLNDLTSTCGQLLSQVVATLVGGQFLIGGGRHVNTAVALVIVWL